MTIGLHGPQGPVDEAGVGAADPELPNAVHELVAVRRALGYQQSEAGADELAGKPGVATGRWGHRVPTGKGVRNIEEKMIGNPNKRAVICLRSIDEGVVHIERPVRSLSPSVASQQCSPVGGRGLADKSVVDRSPDDPE